MHIQNWSIVGLFTNLLQVLTTLLQICAAQLQVLAVLLQNLCRIVASLSVLLQICAALLQVLAAQLQNLCRVVASIGRTLAKSVMLELIFNILHSDKTLSVVYRLFTSVLSDPVTCRQSPPPPELIPPTIWHVRLFKKNQYYHCYHFTFFCIDWVRSAELFIILTSFVIVYKFLST